MGAALSFNSGVFLIITEILICLASQTDVNQIYVTLKHGVTHGGAPFVYLLVYTHTAGTHNRLSGDI